MSILILSPKSIDRNNSTMAWVRNSNFLQAVLPDCWFAGSNQEFRSLVGRKWDVVILPYGFNFVDRDLSRALFRIRPKRVVQLINEYTITLDSRNGKLGGAWFSENGVEVWANMPQSSWRTKDSRIVKWELLNLNVSAFRPRKERLKKTIDLLYWGRMRGDRLPSFSRYFNDRWKISTSDTRKTQRGADHWGTFRERGISFGGKINWASAGNLVAQAKATIYIEDEWTHDHYNSLSDRFYEAISFWCCPFFDVLTKGTISESGYPIGADLIVSDTEEMVDRLSTFSDEDIGAKIELLRFKAEQERDSVIGKIRNLVE